MSEATKKHGSLTKRPIIFTYLNIGPRDSMLKRLIPAWLEAKQITNSVTTNSSPKPRVPSFEILEGKVVDGLTLFEDLMKIGYKPFHIHLQRRDHGGFRVRVFWLDNPEETLPSWEIAWIRMIFSGYVGDVQSHRFYDETEHLPPHVNLSFGNLVERDSATCVYSVQVIEGELVLVNDPDAQVSRSQQILEGSRVRGREALSSLSR